MVVRYVAGSGLLLGREQRWLLLAASPDAPVVEELWAVLGERRPDSLGERVTEVLQRSRPEALPDLALVDLTPGAQQTVLLGRGRASTEGDVRRLTVGLDGSGPGLPLLGGVVRAASVEISSHAAPASVPVGGGALIDGVPPEIWHQRADAPEPSRRREQPPHTVRRAPMSAPAPASAPTSTSAPVEPPAVPDDPDHDGRTVMHRPAGAPTSPPGPPPGPPPAAPPVDHLHQSTRETVLALRCPEGHATPAFIPNCRVCGRPVPPAEPERIPRPRLGLLRLPSGESVPLDRGVILGRKPTAPPDGDWPHLVPVPDSTYVSRQHLRIDLDGWLVVARDLGSRGGSTLRLPGHPDRRMRAFEPYVLEPGEAIDLADAYEVVFEVDQ